MKGFALSSLPEELLLAVLRSLPPKDRHQAAPTCRLWNQLVQCSRGAEQVEVGGNHAALASFQSWLQHGGLQHVRRLQLSPSVSPSKPEYDGQAVRRPLAQLHSVLGSVMGTLRSGSQLAELELRPPFILELDATFELPSSLQRLTLAPTQEWAYVSVDVPLHSLTRLQYLRFGDRASVRFGPTSVLPPSSLSPMLPPSLTQLVFSPQLGCIVRLKHGLAGLSNLVHLELGCRDAEAEDLDVAGVLPRLTRLHLTLPTAVPAWLSQLGGSLQHLRLLSFCEADAAAMDAGLLAQLSLLTCMDLELDFPQRLQALPLAGGALPSLARLCFEHHGEGWQLLAPIDTHLPGGPWLSSIRELDLPAELLLPNLALLSSARLDRVSVAFNVLDPTSLSNSDEEADEPVFLWCAAADSLAPDQVAQLAPLLAWAAGHPHLSHLHFSNLFFDASRMAPPPALSAAMADARQSNPRLHFTWLESRELPFD